MKKSLFILSWLTIFLVAFSGVALAYGFSADMESRTGSDVFTGKIYVATDKMRVEIPMAITITRLDKSLIWILMPEQQMYMEQKITIPTAIPGESASSAEVEKTLLGTETVNGYEAKKYHMVVKDKQGTNSHLQWLTVEHSFPVRMAAEDGSWQQDYKNLVMSEPNADVFEVPAGYNKFNMPL